MVQLKIHDGRKRKTEVSEVKKGKKYKEYTRELKAPFKIVRIQTGIPEFDKLIEGGIPEKSIVLLSGPCGAGKSIFSMRFLVEGALMGEPGVYVSLKESIEETINQMRFFEWPVDNLIEQKKILVVQPELYNFDALLTTLEDTIDRIHAKRLVIDTISILGMYFEDPYKIRKSLLDLGYMLKKLGCTTIAISEIDETQKNLSPYGVEEFVADGVVILYYLKIKKGSEFLRALTIRKMRSTRHSKRVHRFEIKQKGGVLIYPKETIFTEPD